MDPSALRGMLAVRSGLRNGAIYTALLRIRTQAAVMTALLRGWESGCQCCTCTPWLCRGVLKADKPGTAGAEMRQHSAPRCAGWQTSLT